MESFIISVMNKYGYIGICLLILIENLFPPIPSEVILTFGGFMTIDSKMTVIGVILSSTIGSLIGAIILYYFGKILNKERLIKIVKSKYGRILRIKPKDIEQADSWFDSKGNKTVLFCRCVPVIRSFISIPAGMSEMPLVKFIIYTLLGSSIWNTLLVSVGAFAGDKKDLLLGIIENTSNLVLVIICVICLVFTYKFYKKKRK